MYERRSHRIVELSVKPGRSDMFARCPNFRAPRTRCQGVRKFVVPGLKCLHANVRKETATHIFVSDTRSGMSVNEHFAFFFLIRGADVTLFTFEHWIVTTRLQPLFIQVSPQSTK